jgi:Flp pilus assembly protein TadG
MPNLLNGLLPLWDTPVCRRIRQRTLVKRMRGPHRVTSAWRAVADEAGASAVEFALLALPFLMLGLGMLQFLLLHYTQQMLSSALYSTASSPEAELIAGDKSGYIAKLCSKVVFQTDCTNTTTGVKVELMRLTDLPTTATPITGTTFNPGSANDVLTLRAKMPVPQMVFFIPQMTSSDSVIFRR